MKATETFERYSERLTTYATSERGVAAALGKPVQATHQRGSLQRKASS